MLCNYQQAAGTRTTGLAVMRPRQPRQTLRIDMTDLDTSMTSGRVTSRDGTPIGYLKTGRGPAVVILHGSMESARSHTLLAQALAGDFTVYLPDRRGRGMSGPHRPDHSVRTEVEDLQAVLAESGAQLVFGVSAGG